MIERIRAIQRRGARGDAPRAPRWPMIVLRTPKGWTGPKRSTASRRRDRGARTRCRSADVRGIPRTLRQLERWLRSYRPEELFDDAGGLRPELAALAPRGRGAWAPTRTRTAALLLQDLRLPDFRDYAVAVPDPGTSRPRRRGVLGRSCAT
ncbi:MAG: hypothetical protein KatS3mg060_2290 [Dehalococcoidia bacterium]|nr:MAG: hypothetical protein KatS3mg060_2290 [Dehalococcoidia bacterium]